MVFSVRKQGAVLIKKLKFEKRVFFCLKRKLETRCFTYRGHQIYKNKVFTVEKRSFAL
jgi:hypothetical protein